MVQKIAVKHKFVARLCHAMTACMQCDDRKNLSVSPAVNEYLFQIREG